MDAIKLGILSCAWKRPALTAEFLRYHDAIGMPGLLVVSPDDEQPDVSRFNLWMQYEKNNFPVGAKWMFGLDWLRRHSSFDAVMILGSDDFVTPAYIEVCKSLIASGADFIYLKNAYFHDAQSGEMIKGHAKRLGLGRCISMNLVERMNGHLWSPGLNSGLDGDMWQRVGQVGGVNRVALDMQDEIGIAGLDVKTGENIWSYAHIKENLINVQVDADQVLRLFPGLDLSGIMEKTT